jgi:hypothetical protein
MDYDDANQVAPQGLTSERAAAIVVIGALVLLILIKRGFRGVSAGGVSLNVR